MHEINYNARKTRWAYPYINSCETFERGSDTIGYFLVLIPYKVVRFLSFLEKNMMWTLNMYINYTEKLFEKYLASTFLHCMRRRFV